MYMLYMQASKPHSICSQLALLLHPLFFCASAVELVLMRMLPLVDYQVHNKSWTNPNSGHPAPSGS